MQWTICKYNCGQKLSWDSKQKKMLNFGTWTAHDCPSFKNQNQTEVIQKILQKHESMLNEILLKINSLLDTKDNAK
jgi:hypothetical protein